MCSPVNFISDLWFGFIVILEFFDEKIIGADSYRFQDCFMKEKNDRFHISSVKL